MIQRLNTILFLVVLSITSAFALATAQSEPAIATRAYDGGFISCNISDSFLDQAKNVILSELNLSDYSYTNVTYSYCSNYSGYYNIYFTILVKENASSIAGKQISGSYYASTTYDYDVLFNEKERNTLDYTLKQKYAEYISGGEDEEYYVSINKNYEASSCEALKEYYDTLSGEKYFNEDYGYCSIILKTKTSEVRSLVSDSISYIYYFSDKIKYHFQGYSEQTNDISALVNSLRCDLSKQDYYYPEFTSDCYGIYKDKSRIYLSSSLDLNNTYASVSIYGIIGGRGRVSVYAYGRDLTEKSAEINDFVNKLLRDYFNTELTESLSLGSEFVSDTVDLYNLEVNMEKLSELNISDSMMNRYYSGDNIYATVTEPYIQVYVPENSDTTVSSSTEAIMPRPYYWGRYFVITGTRVYSEIALDSNDLSLAESKIKEFVSPYIETGSWSLNMTVTGNYYPILYDGVYRGGVMESASSTGAASVGSFSGALQDPLASAYSDFADFEAETSKSLWTSIVDFVKALLS